MPNNILLAFKNNLKMKFLIFTVCLITIGNCAVLKSTDISSWEQFKVNKLFYFFEELNCTNLSHFFYHRHFTANRTPQQRKSRLEKPSSSKTSLSLPLLIIKTSMAPSWASTSFPTNLMRSFLPEMLTSTGSLRSIRAVWWRRFRFWRKIPGSTTNHCPLTGTGESTFAGTRWTTRSSMSF